MRKCSRPWDHYFAGHSGAWWVEAQIIVTKVIERTSISTGDYSSFAFCPGQLSAELTSMWSGYGDVRGSVASVGTGAGPALTVREAGCRGG